MPPQVEDELVFSADYIGDGIWSVTKTCPINAECNGAYYFYEDSGALAEKGLAPLLAGSTVPCGEPEAPDAAGDLTQTEVQEFSKLYCDMKHHLEDAYALTHHLQYFGWYGLVSLSWKSKDEYGVERTVKMADTLPHSETVKPFLAQYEKCNALAIEVWLERPYKSRQTPDHETGNLTLREWRALCRRLQSQLREARRELGQVKSDTSKQFANIEHGLSTSASPHRDTWFEEFQLRHPQYTELLDQAIGTLEEAERLTSKLRRWEFSPGSTTQWK